MEQTGKNLRGGRQLPLQQGLIREMRMQGTEKDARQREPEERQQTVGTVKVWSVVE
ncbi:MAG: hypothetical protein IJ631_05345 [Schwartzia sp.]|nr:hypothetical protein [Schwartzia sp. (in: firmicutes)]